MEENEKTIGWADNKKGKFYKTIGRKALDARGSIDPATKFSKKQMNYEAMRARKDEYNDNESCPEREETKG